MRRDDELKRLINYAKGLNIKVMIKPYVPYSMDIGYATTDSTEITIFKGKHSSKIELILTTIHEVAHAMFNKHNQDKMTNLNYAIADTDETKQSRKVIYEYEKECSEWWDVIYRDTEMKFPLYWLKRQKEFDVWQYEYWYDVGSFPNKKMKAEKHKQLKEKYKC